MLKNKRVGKLIYTSYVEYASLLYKQPLHLNCLSGQRINLCTERKPSQATIADLGKWIKKDGCSDFSNIHSATSAPLPTALYGIRDKLKSNYHKLEDQTKEVSDSDIAALLVRYSKDKGKVGIQKDNQEDLKGIEVGDTIDLHGLLFTKRRNYLIRYNGTQVKSEHLAGKVVVLYFLLLPLSHNSSLRERWDFVVLKDVYNYLTDNKDFEVVFVAVDDTDTRCNEEKLLHPHTGTNLENQFKDVFSCMPWPAIPLSDITSRKYLQRKFCFRENVSGSNAFVIDSTGMVLRKNAHWCFDYYGAVGYPFSFDRLNLLHSEYKAIAMQPSLAKLLSSPQRDYLISNNEEKVPIHTLEDKVVALFFYVPNVTDSLLEELKKAYKELAERKENFEVVLLYLCDSQNAFGFKSEESFWKVFKSMPWLALPYNDPNLKKLKIIYQYPREDELVGKQVSMLVIVGPRGEFCEPCGADILLNYKVPGYPFTREKALELETEKLKELKLEMLWEPNAVFRGNNGCQVSLSQLTGKKIILLFGPFEDEFLNMLKERYLCMKDTDGEFEVIHVYILDTEDEDEDADEEPWLKYPLPEDFLHAPDFLPFEFDKRYLKYGETYDVGLWTRLLAFDQAGRIVRDTAFPTIEYINFPFYKYGLEQEILFHLDSVFCWYTWKNTTCYCYSSEAGYIGPNHCYSKPVGPHFRFPVPDYDDEIYSSIVKKV